MVSNEEQWKKVLLGQYRAVAFIMLNIDSSTSVKIVHQTHSGLQCGFRPFSSSK